MPGMLGVLVLAVSAAVTGAPSTSACARCHPREVRAHERTRMATAMMPALASPFARNLPTQPLSESADGYAFEYRVTDQGLLVIASRGKDRAQGIIEWVIGSGEQGQTPLVRTAHGIAQHRVSYFPQLNRYGITIGDDAGSSPNAESALGRSWSKSDLKACLNCHATSVSENLQDFIPGIQCIRCHPGAAEHARGIGMPLNPGKLAPSAQIEFCGECHRLKAPGKEADLENVRFQPLRLSKSKCFAMGKLACTTCHAAHEDVRRNDAAYYNAKCLSCHVRQAHADERQHESCVGCHMPAVQLHPALRFTDHFIRVVTASTTAGEH